MNKADLLRRSLCCCVALVVLALPVVPRAQAVNEIPQSNITYILPQWPAFATTPDATFASELAELRARIPEGPRVKVGFTTYINISMSDPNVDPSNPAAIQAALAGTFQQMDTAINRARQYGVPICLSFLTAIRDSADAVEIAGQAADRRNMQWYSRENMLASNWST